LQEDLANNNQLPIVPIKNDTKESQIVDEVKVVVGKVTTKSKSNDKKVDVSPKEMNSSTNKLQEDLANNNESPVVTNKNNTKDKQIMDQASKDPINMMVDKATVMPMELVPLVMSDSCNRGCEDCIGYIKVTPEGMERYTASVIKRALQLRDGIHEQVWKEFAGNFYN